MTKAADQRGTEEANGTADAASSLFELDQPTRRSGARNAAISGETAANQNAEANGGGNAELTSLASADESALDEELQALTDADILPDSDAAALTAEDQIAAAAAGAKTTASVSTRASTHVPDSERFDSMMDLSSGANAIDFRQRLAARFKACSAALRMLGPLSPMEERREIVTLLQKYEQSLRTLVPAPPSTTKHVTDALHAALPVTASDELERLLGKIEELLLQTDESVADEAFRMRWNKERETPKALLRYGRLLASKRFNIGFRRDRFEALAQELLTAKTPSGTLLLMPRTKAGPVLKQLLRGLPRETSTAQERIAAITYLRDALERLQSLQTPKAFFDSGFFLDVHGYKLSMHDHIVNPEFLYLCVALNVEIHNLLHSFSKAEPEGKQGRGSAPPMAALLAQLRQQEQSVQTVFKSFRKPRDANAPAVAPASGKRSAPRTKRIDRPAAVGGRSLLSVVLTGLFLLAAVGANLLSTGVVRLHEPPVVLTPEELHALSPLLLRGTLDRKQSRFDGLVSRPVWSRLPLRERRTAASALAKSLEQHGIHHGRVLAYKSRAFEAEFGGVSFVDDAP